MFAIAAAFAVSLISIAGVLLSRASTSARVFYFFFLPVSIGMFLGVTFFELLPETFAASEHAGIAVAVGFLGFFLLSRLLREYHHHHSPDEAEAAHRGRGALVLAGDGVHNFADGIVIAAAFSVDPMVGVLATAGIALHELPQEIAEFSILIQAGYSRARALAYNFLSASATTLGAIVGLGFLHAIEGSFGLLLGLAAGNLLYIAASDLLPELTHGHGGSHANFKRQFALVCAACLFIGAAISFAHAYAPEHGHDHHDHEAEDHL